MEKIILYRYIRNTLLLPWRFRQQDPTKRIYLSTKLHRVTLQKTEVFSINISLKKCVWNCVEWIHVGQNGDQW